MIKLRICSYTNTTSLTADPIEIATIYSTTA